VVQDREVAEVDYKQDVDSKIDLKKLCDAQQLQLSHVLNIWCHVM